MATTAALRQALTEANYTTDAVIERIGKPAHDALGRNSTFPASVVLDGDDDALATLIRLFILQRSIHKSHAEVVFDLDALIEAGIVCADQHQIRACLDVRPYDSPDDGASGYLVSDLTPGLDGQITPIRADYVLGASPASLSLTQMTIRRPVARALDLGTGCGVQTLHLSRHVDQVVATDVNPRALEMARRGLALSGVTADLRQGSLFEPVAGESFDLIVSNPPYVMSPPDGERLTYREGTFTADGLTETIVRQAPDYLRDGGCLQLLTNWALIRNQPWQERLASWVDGSGCDAWIIERERLDRYCYIEMWLTDAGLQGSAQWEPSYRRWLEYFDQLGIDEVGMGWILLVKAGRSEPHVRIESWPHQIAQPISDVFARHRAAVDAACLPEDQLLLLRPVLHQVVQETIGEPGAAEPNHIVLRQRTGLLRGIEVSTVTGAVLGALDGQLRVGAVIDAVATILEVDPSQVAAEALPVIRRALEEQFLIPAA